MDRNDEIRFFRLLTLKLSGEAVDRDLAELEALLRQYPECCFLYDQVTKPLPVDEQQLLKAQQAYAAHYVNKICQQAAVKEQMPQGNKESRNSRRMRYGITAAAVLVLLAGIGWLADLTFTTRTQQQKTEVRDVVRSKSNITLPDGTQVILNAGSKLTYDDEFKGQTREVRLTGEAYFDVVHDAQHPFIIHTGTGIIKVLGTSFNVRDYENEPSFETTLIRGRVEVNLNANNTNKIVLKPGEKVVVTKRQALSRKNRASEVTIKPFTITEGLVAEISWTKGQLAFVNTPLSDIARDLDRQFGVRIRFQSDRVKEYKYTGVFDETNAEEILKILSLSRKFRFVQEKDEIIIY